jgi:deoxyuridine 5'-triphosphate nucleotidohydrolase
MNNLKVYKKYPDVKNIEFATKNSACFDISAYIPYQQSVKSYTTSNDEVEKLAVQEKDSVCFIELPSQWRALIPTGLIFEIPVFHCVKIYARSGISTKKGLNLINSTGVIDSDYYQELFIPIFNNSQERLRISNGDRIAQGKLELLIQHGIEYVNERPQLRGERYGGFGSTDHTS